MSESLPTAAPAPRRARFSVVWVLPILAILVSLGLGIQAWFQRGMPIEITFARTEGLNAGDSIRHRGVDIGKVGRVSLSSDGHGVIVEATLMRQAELFARTGARFWIVRPEVGIGGISGLETMIGPRYLGADPGDGPVVRYHAGLDSAPGTETTSPGSRRIFVTATTAGGLRSGSPVTYRQLQVGQVGRIELASDATAVECEIIIDPAYVDLVRTKSVFWNASGFDLAGGIFKGIRVEVESIQSLVSGGLAFATPDEPGETVPPNHRFKLAADAPEKAREWKPAIAVGASLLPAGQMALWPTRARMTCQYGRWRQRLLVREGWAIPDDQNWIIPSDLVIAPADVLPETQRLTIDGREVKLPETVANDVAVLRVAREKSWRDLRIQQRPWDKPEDMLVYGDPAYGPMPIPLQKQDEKGNLKDKLEGDWHGALARARSDGALLGMIIQDETDARIVTIPTEKIADTSDASNPPASKP